MPFDARLRNVKLNLSNVSHTANANILQEIKILQQSTKVYKTKHTLRAVGFSVLRQTREKPLRATVCFSIEHAQVRHAPRDTDKIANFSPKVLTKERSMPSSKYCIYLVCGL